MAKMITLQNVTFSFKDSDNSMCFDLSVNKGEKVAIIGASGTGKTTLLNLISGFLFATHGNIILNNTNHNNSQPYHRPVSVLFQSNNLFNHLTVHDNIALGIKPNLKLSPIDIQSVDAIANKVGLQDFLEKMPDQLSGGQQQRVALARSLLRDKPILLLDEPFSALDKNLRKEMADLITKICDEKNITLLIVTHQPDELEHLVDRVIEIRNGKL